MGSACELEYQALLAFDLGMIESDAYQVVQRLLAEIKRMLVSLIQRVKTGFRNKHLES